jgi:hypothetical protein
VASDRGDLGFCAAAQQRSAMQLLPLCHLPNAAARV